MAPKETYFIEKSEAGWLVRQRKPGGAVTLCTTDNRDDAEDIRAAMNVLPYAQEAAGELADGVTDGPAQEELVEALKQMHILQRKTAAQREMESCISRLWQTALGIMAGIGTLILIIWIIQLILSR